MKDISIIGKVRSGRDVYNTNQNRRADSHLYRDNYYIRRGIELMRRERVVNSQYDTTTTRASITSISCISRR